MATTRTARRRSRQAMAAVRESKATVYVIGIGGVAGVSLRGEDLLRQLATATGGRAFFPSREFQLTDVHGLIASDVQQRYVVSYTPLNQRLDGTFRRVEVKTADPDARHHRAGRLHGAGAAADSSADRTHGTGSHASASGCDAGGLRRVRGRRRASGRGVRGGAESGEHHARARSERLDAQGRAGRRGGGAHIRAPDAGQGPRGRHAVLGPADPRAGPLGHPRVRAARDREVPGQRRHGALRLTRREPRSARARSRGGRRSWC